MEILIDTHIHTLFSGHAYGSIIENAQAAKAAGLTMMAITDHGPGMPGSCHKYYFYNFSCIPREIGGVTVLMGVEANIMLEDGTLDLDDKRLKKMDLVIASLHEKCLKAGDCKTNTRTMTNVIANQSIDILGHLDDARYPVDLETIIGMAKEAGKWIEINNSSLDKNNPRYQEGNMSLLSLIEECKKQAALVSLGSDAHFPTQVGDFSATLSILKELHFPEYLIVNHNRNYFEVKMKKSVRHRERD